jgi:hypothetical protein
VLGYTAVEKKREEVEVIRSLSQRNNLRFVFGYSVGGIRRMVVADEREEVGAEPAYIPLV